MKSRRWKWGLVVLLVLIPTAVLAWWCGIWLPQPDLLATPWESRGSLAVTFAPDGQTLAFTRDKEVRLWDVASRSEKRILKGKGSQVYCLAFSPDGKLLASGDWEGAVRLWEVNSGKERSILQAKSTTVVWSVAFSPDGKTLAATGRGEAPSSINGVPSPGIGEVNLWDVAKGKRQAFLSGHTSHVSRVAFSPDGKTLASASDDETVKLWNMGSDQLRATLKGHRGGIFALAYSPDGKTVASGSYDGVRMWETTTGKLLATLKGSAGTPRSLAFAPDGKTLAAGCGDHSILFSTGPGRVELWDTESHRVRSRWTAQEHGLIISIAFSPDGKTLATVGDRGNVKLWDITKVTSRTR
jgi:WD40 repeat protein